MSDAVTALKTYRLKTLKDAPRVREYLSNFIDFAEGRDDPANSGKIFKINIVNVESNTTRDSENALDRFALMASMYKKLYSDIMRVHAFLESHNTKNLNVIKDENDKKKGDLIKIKQEEFDEFCFYLAKNRCRATSKPDRVSVESRVLDTVRWVICSSSNKQCSISLSQLPFSRSDQFVM